MMDWIKCSDRLPEKYRDVPVLLSDGRQWIGRLNHQGSWLLASYHQTKHQYVGEVAMWFDTPAPPTE